jgi:hypothetical protein
MAGHDSDTPAATRPSPTKIPPSVVTEVGCLAVALPPAAVGKPEADLECQSGPKWQRRVAAGYGHAREQHAI